MLEGYHALGGGAALGQEVGAAFIAAATAATLKVPFRVCVANYAAQTRLVYFCGTLKPAPSWRWELPTSPPPPPPPSQYPLIKNCSLRTALHGTGYKATGRLR